MNRLLLAIACVFFLSQFSTTSLFGQDPVAKQMLESVKENVLSEANWKFTFELKVRFPEMEPDIIEGTLHQKGDHFRVDLGEQVIISDGESIWTWIKDFNEVQITEYEDDLDEMFMSPAQIVQMYESGKYEYQHSGKQTLDGKAYDFIEMKPTDPRASDYVKINLLLDMDNLVPGYAAIIARNGTVYELAIRDHERGGDFPENLFTFDPNDFPGAEIEDLRLN